MVKRFSTESLASVCARHPWRTIIVWTALLAGAIISISLFMADATSTDFTFSNNPESLRGYKFIEEGFPEIQTGAVEEFVIISSPTLTVDDPEFQAYSSGVYQDILGLGEKFIESAVYYYLPPGPQFPEEVRRGFVTEDRHTTFILVKMAGSESEAIDNAGIIKSVTIDTDPEGDFEILITGVASLNEDFNKTAESTLQRAELIGIPIAVAILVVVFGALVAASIPLILSGIAIIMAVGMVALVGQTWQMSFFVVNMITMMGLAVGIDYALFIVSRYREERNRGLDKSDAIVRTGATASHAVLFSGLTVILALAGLLIIPMSLFQSLAAGAIFVVAMAILATLTLLPAVLYLLGRRVRSKWIRQLFSKRAADGGAEKPAANVDKKGGFWDWESKLVMKHPIVSLILSAGLLVALALPALPIDRYEFGIKTGQATMDVFPSELPAIKGFLTLQERFPFAFTPEAVIVLKGDIESAAVQDGLQRLRTAMSADSKAFGQQMEEDQVNADASMAIIRVPLSHQAVSREATGKIEELRLEMIPAAFEGVDAEVLVTGEAAENLDYYDTTDRYRYIVFAFVLGLSFILLTVVFRSLVVPLKAIIMNLLSVFASYGLLVLVFQKGYGAGLLSFEKVETIDAWIPLFLFAILFGLSMDYHVFLLSRIRERYLKTGDNTESVAFGLRTTGGIITGAALIMVAIFGGFAAGDLVMFQQMGFGMATAVLLDATIIRSVLVPSSMRLLGRHNWYLPKWLNWLPELHVEGEKEDSPEE